MLGEIGNRHAWLCVASSKAFQGMQRHERNAPPDTPPETYSTNLEGCVNECDVTIQISQAHCVAQ